MVTLPMQQSPAGFLLFSERLETVGASTAQLKGGTGYGLVLAEPDYRYERLSVAALQRCHDCRFVNPVIIDPGRAICATCFLGVYVPSPHSASPAFDHRHVQRPLSALVAIMV